jgi:light-regulated signal transduction histidine kinase (bacteriophytochrome)
MLIDDLLVFSRMGRKTIDAATCNVKALAQEAFKELQDASDGKRVNWLIHPMPEAQCDRTLLHQVWANLFSQDFRSLSSCENIRI